MHRLLGVTPAGFAHDAAHPLAIDALVVDEASMLDLALATQLLEAVPPAARIILLGDKDQLAAVESGAVFAELSVDPTLTPACVRELAAMTGTPAAAIVPPPPAHAQRAAGLRRLVHADLPLRRATRASAAWPATSMRAGRARPLALAARRRRRRRHLAGRRRAAGASLDAALHAMMDAGYAAYLRGGRRRPVAGRRDHRGLRPLPRAVRVARRAARRDGAERRDDAPIPRGAATCPGSTHGPGASPWFAGRPVLVLNNDYVLRLFNGDIGIALPGADGELLVHFPDAAADGGFRAIAPVRLPRHETAFAMTVHKSQGSEFDGVLVMLPEQRSRVLTRELLYTAITRARHRVTLVAGAAVLEQAIATSTARHSGLLARLAEAERELR